METILLNQEQVRDLISMKEVVEICDKTFQGLGDGTVINPTKVTLDLGEKSDFPPYEGFMNSMPAYVGWTDTAGIKWVGGFAGKRKEAGLPFITSLTILIDPQLGTFKSVMDGAYITNLRTGAQTAVALKYMLEKKSIKIGLYGGGVQARTQIEAISQLFNIEELKVYDTNKEYAVKFAEDMKKYVDGEIIVVDKSEDAAIGDVIISATQSKDKFIKNNWIKQGTILVAMGSYQECDDEFILSADKIVVDHMEHALNRGALKELHNSGNIEEKDIFATIGELASGSKECHITPDERILCVPIGTGALDIAVASIIYNKALEKGIGGKYKFV